MPLRVLIAPDKFKGTLTASAATQAMAAGWRSIRPRDQLDLLPISDGGDGFGEVLSRLLHAEACKIATVDAAHRKVQGRWWWESETRTALIESANVIGLAMLPPGKFHPFELDTFGLGALIRAAVRKGAERCLIGIGGSATNDGGFGLARALGWEFLDKDGKRLERWTELHRLDAIREPKELLQSKEWIVAVDVRNPLLGPDGATRVYGPQKGLKPGELAGAEKNLRRLAQVCAARRLPGDAAIPGAGAAGGLGFGLMTFLGAKLEPGFNLVTEFARLDQRLRAADLVITGEGCIDGSTLMGKGVGELARRARRQKIPCIALAGRVVQGSRVQKLFKEIHALAEITTLARARSKPAYWLEQLAQRVAERCSVQHPA